jgi:hypothetical protein
VKNGPGCQRTAARDDFKKGSVRARASSPHITPTAVAAAGRDRALESQQRFPRQMSSKRSLAIAGIAALFLTIDAASSEAKHEVSVGFIGHDRSRQRGRRLYRVHCQAAAAPVSRGSWVGIGSRIRRQRMRAEELRRPDIDLLYCSARLPPIPTNSLTKSTGPASVPAGVWMTNRNAGARLRGCRSLAKQRAFNAHRSQSRLLAT